MEIILKNNPVIMKQMEEILGEEEDRSVCTVHIKSGTSNGHESYRVEEFVFHYAINLDTDVDDE